MSNQVTESITVDRATPEVYDLWANFENFPHFMQHIKSVRRIDEETSHWVMDGPLGILIAWDVETTTREKNKRLAWNSKDKDGDVKTSGQVEFKSLPENRTEVTVTLRYVPPAGAVGDAAAEWFVKPESRLHEDLKNFKAYAEGKLEPETLPAQESR